MRCNLVVTTRVPDSQQHQCRASVTYFKQVNKRPSAFSFNFPILAPFFRGTVVSFSGRRTIHLWSDVFCLIYRVSFLRKRAKHICALAREIDESFNRPMEVTHA